MRVAWDKEQSADNNMLVQGRLCPFQEWQIAIEHTWPIFIDQRNSIDSQCAPPANQKTSGWGSKDPYCQQKEPAEKTRGLGVCHLEKEKKNEMWAKKIENIYSYPPFLEGSAQREFCKSFLLTEQNL